MANLLQWLQKGENEYVWLEFDENGQLLNSPAS